MARRIDRRHRFAIVPYQSLSDAELARAGLDSQRAARALHLVTGDGRLFWGPFAVNAFARRFAALAPFAFALERIPLALALETAGYALVARYRGSIGSALGLRRVSVDDAEL